ncbi:LacI family DNA-binding transcriptional regulator [Brucella gallinifaecis]|uniref:LacI family DNA-binding transcriptional regulator n=1 Tax=Brucella gallinifaecis TaxID=215590 RepID=A0A502BTM1_9HYPH|nr:LacI family DNA-binding transcriptional regulator [Brucella gallinifaecis]TPF77207.1 LacI family DNA-binding transcriptional regulator [Brucella gallinifaecis]
MTDKDCFQDELPENQPRFISAHEVAVEAGVSRSAVSRTFTPGASVSPSTREKVLKAAEKLGYQVNDLARGLLAKRSHIVGMIAADPASPFRSRQIEALSRRLTARGSVPVLIPTGQHGENLSAAHQTLLRYRAEATVVLSGMPSSSFIELAQRNGQTLIVVGRNEDGPDHIRINNRQAAETAVDVFAARGIKHLGLVTSNVRSPNLLEREEAYITRAKTIGLDVSIQRGELTDYDGGFAAASLLLSERDRVEAVFCVNDLMAFGLMDCARDVFNLSIPEDLSVIGFDNVAEARWGAYRLTTFDQNAERLSVEIVRMLDERQNKPNLPPQMVMIDTPLILRGSVRPLKNENVTNGKIP